ncbi:hypothetical protein ZWY2020_000457 [Hordeum vulgare]|nr:hypothetical protein ZWY2020_000457 [Hordeum vulgare]
MPELPSSPTRSWPRPAAPERAAPYAQRHRPAAAAAGARPAAVAYITSATASRRLPDPDLNRGRAALYCNAGIRPPLAPVAGRIRVGGPRLWPPSPPGKVAAAASLVPRAEARGGRSPARCPVDRAVGTAWAAPARSCSHKPAVQVASERVA